MTTTALAAIAASPSQHGGQFIRNEGEFRADKARPKPAGGGDNRTKAGEKSSESGGPVLTIGKNRPYL